MDYIAAACLLDQSDASSDEEFENTLAVFYLLQQGSKKERKIYPRSFVLDELDDDVCWTNFRFQKEDIPRLAEALNLPEFIKTSNNLTISRVEALCVLLRRLAYPSRLTDVGAVFGGHAADISTISNQVLNLIYELHNQRLTTFDHSWLNLAALRQKVTDKGSPIQECFGFIDGTVRPIARPTQNQREVFSGHKRVHALKFQAVTLPNGIVGQYGPMSGRRHDSALLAESGLLGEPRRSAEGYCIYGDQAYPIQQQLIAPFRGAALTPEQEAFNAAMGKMRLCVEWSFGKIVQYFAFLDFKKNQKLLLQPVAKLYLVGCLLTNCHTCLYGSVTSSYFDCVPPTLEDYLY